MDDDRLKRQQFQRALRQRLESLQRAGVEQLPRAAPTWTRRRDPGPPATLPSGKRHHGRATMVAASRTGNAPPARTAIPAWKRHATDLSPDTCYEETRPPHRSPLAKRKTAARSRCATVCERANGVLSWLRTERKPCSASEIPAHDCASSARHRGRRGSLGRTVRRPCRSVARQDPSGLHAETERRLYSEHRQMPSTRKSKSGTR